MLLGMKLFPFYNQKCPGEGPSIASNSRKDMIRTLIYEL